MRSRIITIAAITGVVTAVVTTAALLAAAVTTAAVRENRQPAETAGAVYGQNLIRFHVIANSDSDRDQAMKRKVRDLVVARMTPEFKKAASLDEARRIASAHLDEIRDIARKEISNWGEDYPVKVQLGRFDFPVKTYGKLTLPAGNYEAVRVVIGKGQGANWWCVLFPPLCFVDVSKAMSPVDIQDTAAAVYSPEQSGMQPEPGTKTGLPGTASADTGSEGDSSAIGGGSAAGGEQVRVRFKVLEWLGWSFD